MIIVDRNKRAKSISKAANTSDSKLPLSTAKTIRQTYANILSMPINKNKTLHIGFIF